MSKNNNNFYKSWFDTPYYQILYKNRDYKEAEMFTKELMEFIKLPSNSKILDLACGEGRHSINLNKMGYDVTGVDLSVKNIKNASKYESENLKFKIHDMRKPFGQKFDLVVNLFTSFGYFDDFKDNLKTLDSIKSSLKKNGLAVIDFLNIKYLKNNLIHKNTEEIDGIKFHLNRSIKNGFLTKKISFKHELNEYNFEEKVRSLDLIDFKSMFKQSNIEILHIFGDYKLTSFDENNSKRLIFILK
ncbi:MAG: class I SAM-dependent methyltransferase [Flavobacteriales bacterium]|nr:class I SAM-dependent methyltransferase [Flavobacteriales bacterium]MBL6877895.1 class I SAM-dependent methyltransferase [Flavobacteriaceae bacterium]